MAAKGLRKLVELPATATELHAQLESALRACRISSTAHYHAADDRLRYYVHIADLKAAKAIAEKLRGQAAASRAA